MIDFLLNDEIRLEVFFILVNYMGILTTLTL